MKPTNRPSSRKQLKKILETPTSPLNFVLMCLVFVFKRFVFSPLHVKIGLYMSALLVCSVLKDFHLISNMNYFAQKNNVFNVYFVKFGWAWTLIACIPFVLMTSLVYTAYNLNVVKNHLIRIAIATLAWYVFTSSFDYIDSLTGKCTNKEIALKHVCKKSKHEWINGFDISGHTFILMHSLFMMIEEVKVFHDWDLFHRKLSEKLGFSTSDKEPGEKATIDNQYKRAEILYKLFTPFIKLNFIFMAILALLWEAMLLTTFLYFHTIMHKLVAASLAIIVWFFTYKTWYANPNLLISPGLPGDGTI